MQHTQHKTHYIMQHRIMQPLCLTHQKKTQKLENTTYDNTTSILNIIENKSKNTKKHDLKQQKNTQKQPNTKTH